MSKRKPTGYWTKERCHEEALKYNTRKTFQNNNQTAYQKSRKNGWLDDICSHMVLQHKPRGYWSFNRCHEEALKYETRGEFQLSNKTAYTQTAHYGWLDEVCTHMKIVGNKYKRCIYAYEFTDNNVYIGLTYNLENRHKDRLKDKNDSVTKHINKTNLQPIIKKLTDYINVEEAIKLEEYYVNQYKENEWHILNKVKTGSIGGNNLKWSYENCKEEASKYKTRVEYKRGSESSYQKSRINGWLDSICSHMKQNNNKPSNYWTFDRCEELAVKYKYRNDFKNGNRSAYGSAYKNNWLDIICSHMPKRKNHK